MSDWPPACTANTMSAAVSNGVNSVATTLLLIEDDRAVVASLTNYLSAPHQPKFVVRAASTLREGLCLLNACHVDVVILDLSLPDSADSETFRTVQGAAPDIPILILSGTSDEELAVRLVQHGAQDYFVKGEGNIHLLPRSIRYAIERKRSEEALRASERQLHALADRLQSFREEDRVRLARELHDRIGQDLAVLRMELVAVAGELVDDGGGLRDKTLTMADSVISTIAAVREMCADLRPQMLDDLGLMPALDWHAQQFAKRTGIACRLSGSAVQVVDPARAVAVYRIVQEAMTNALRHAAASCIDITAMSSGAELEVSIRDNGRGITSEQTKQRQSLGILGMRERVQSFGGTFVISGTPGKGTCVTIRMPLSAS